MLNIGASICEGQQTLFSMEALPSDVRKYGTKRRACQSLVCSSGMGLRACLLTYLVLATAKRERRRSCGTRFPKRCLVTNESSVSAS